MWAVVVIFDYHLLRLILNNNILIYFSVTRVRTYLHTLIFENAL